MLFNCFSIGNYLKNTIHPISIEVSGENEKYAEKDGSIYDKTTGELVIGMVRDGVLKIPDTVRKVGWRHALLGGGIKATKKVIVLASVTEFEFDRELSFGLDYIFEGKIPPKGEDKYMFYNCKIYVQKGCAEIYKDWVANLGSGDYTIEEMQE